MPRTAFIQPPFAIVAVTSFHPGAARTNTRQGSGTNGSLEDREESGEGEKWSPLARDFDVGFIAIHGVVPRIAVPG